MLRLGPWCLAFMCLLNQVSPSSVLPPKLVSFCVGGASRTCSDHDAASGPKVGSHTLRTSHKYFHTRWSLSLPVQNVLFASIPNPSDVFETDTVTQWADIKALSLQITVLEPSTSVDLLQEYRPTWEGVRQRHASTTWAVMSSRLGQHSLGGRLHNLAPRCASGICHFPHLEGHTRLLGFQNQTTMM